MCEQLLANTVIENYAYRAARLTRGASHESAPASSSFPASTATATSAVALRGARSAHARRAWSGTGDDRAAGERPDRAARRLLLWRLSALRRHGGAFADHARGGRARAAGGTPVLGICNGFQVLDRGGAAARRADAQRRRSNSSAATCICASSAATRSSPAAISKGEVVALPIAHDDGNYFADDATLDRLEGEGRVAFRYCDTRRRDHGRRQSQRLARATSPASTTNRNRPRADAASRAPRRPAARRHRRRQDVPLARGDAPLNVAARAARAADSITPEIVAEHGLSADEYQLLLDDRSAASRR